MKTPTTPMFLLRLFMLRDDGETQVGNHGGADWVDMAVVSAPTRAAARKQLLRTDWRQWVDGHPDAAFVVEGRTIGRAKASGAHTLGRLTHDLIPATEEG